MYAPAEDTLLLAECVSQYRGKWALEIGVGSGAVLGALAANFQNVAGSDIDCSALEYCSRLYPQAMLACCDSASAFRGKFDLVASNPPYLPDDDDDDGDSRGGKEKEDRTVYGGPRGVETTVRFIESALPLLAKGGRMLVVVSSLADQAALDSFLKEKGLAKKVVKEKALFFERLAVLELAVAAP